jgi:phosphatidyl-myo-inositol dimannoside synthase
MKCLLLTYEYPPFKGGVAAYLSNIVDAKPVGIEVTVDVPKKNEHWIMTSVRLLLSPQRHDICIISHVLPAGYIAWYLKVFRRTPYVAIVHGTDILTARKNPWKRFFMRCNLKSARTVIANSRFTAGLLKDEGISRVEIVPPGVKSSTSPRVGEGRVRYGQGKEILAIGRLIPRKGFDTLIRAMPTIIKEVPEARAKIIGRGAYLEELDRLAHELRVETFVDIVTDADDVAKEKALSEAAVFALPARQEGHDIEGFGIVVLEASAAGLSVIVGRSGGAPETVVDGVTGIVILPDSSEELAKAAIGLLKDPRAAKKMGEEGRKYVSSEYSLAKTAERFWNIIQNSPYPPL